MGKNEFYAVLLIAGVAAVTLYLWNSASHTAGDAGGYQQPSEFAAASNDRGGIEQDGSDSECGDDPVEVTEATFYDERTFHEVVDSLASDPACDPTFTANQPVLDGTLTDDENLEQLEFEVIEDNCEPSDAPVSSTDVQNQRFRTAVEIVNSAEVWLPFMASLINALKFVYDSASPINSSSADRLRVLNSGVQCWTQSPSNTSYRTGGARVYQNKTYVIAFSNKLLPYPVIMITFPGMELCIADLRTVVSFLAVTTGNNNNANGAKRTGLEVHGGFAAAAESCFPEIVQHIDSLLKMHSLTANNVQMLCCGHSLGGAIATLCAYFLVQHYYRGDNAENNVLIFSLGQPKSIKAASVPQFNRTVKQHNYVRFVTYGTYHAISTETGRGSTAKDAITGFQRVHRDAPDTIGMKHGGTEQLINSGIMLKNENFSPSPLKAIMLSLGVPVAALVASRFITGKERFRLHSQEAYYAALANYTRERQAASTNTHHTGKYCDAKWMFWQEKWWNCCGKPNFDAPFCHAGPIRSHPGDWQSVRNKWDCCKNTTRGCAGCSSNNAQLHHPGRYSVKYGVYFCCMQRQRSAAGCQSGPPRHHPREWHKKQWKCCKNASRKCKGCKSGI